MSKKSVMAKRNKSKEPDVPLSPASEFNIQLGENSKQPDLNPLDPSEWTEDRYGMRHMPKVHDWIMTEAGRKHGMTKEEFEQFMESKKSQDIIDTDKMIESQIAQECRENEGTSSTLNDIKGYLRNPFYGPEGEAHRKKLDELLEMQKRDEEKKAEEDNAEV